MSLNLTLPPRAAAPTSLDAVDWDAITAALNPSANRTGTATTSASMSWDAIAAAVNAEAGVTVPAMKG